MKAGSVISNPYSPHLIRHQLCHDITIFIIIHSSTPIVSIHIHKIKSFVLASSLPTSVLRIVTPILDRSAPRGPDQQRVNQKTAGLEKRSKL